MTIVLEFRCPMATSSKVCRLHYRCNEFWRSWYWNVGEQSSVVFGDCQTKQVCPEIMQHVSTRDCRRRAYFLNNSLKFLYLVNNACLLAHVQFCTRVLLLSLQDLCKFSTRFVNLNSIRKAVKYCSSRYGPECGSISHYPEAAVVPTRR